MLIFPVSNTLCGYRVMPIESGVTICGYRVMPIESGVTICGYRVMPMESGISNETIQEKTTKMSSNKT